MNKFDKHKRANIRKLTRLGYTTKTAKSRIRFYYKNFDEWVHFKYDQKGEIK